MGYKPQTINSNEVITSAWGNKIENQLGVTGTYLGQVQSRGLLNNLSPDYKDFAWVQDEKQFYWYDGSGWHSYDVKKLTEGFTLVNLLGSYGGFYKDSDGNGLADGWNFDGISGTLVAGISGNAQQITGTVLPNLRIFVLPTLRVNHKYFYSNFLKATVGNIQSYVVFDTTTSIGWTSSTTWVHQYLTGKITYPHIYNIIGISVNAVGSQGVVDNASFYDLTWMDQYSPMPQSLKDKYLVDKWVDMTDDDLANELPYVDGVAYVGVES